MTVDKNDIAFLAIMLMFVVVCLIAIKTDAAEPLIQALTSGLSFLSGLAGLVLAAVLRAI
jgi:hypothetical protein